jgi:hypothetical protein
MYAHLAPIDASSPDSAAPFDSRRRPHGFKPLARRGADLPALLLADVDPSSCGRRNVAELDALTGLIEQGDRR